MEGPEWSRGLGTHRSFPAPQQCLRRSALRPAPGKMLLLVGEILLAVAFKGVQVRMSAGGAPSRTAVHREAALLEQALMVPGSMSTLSQSQVPPGGDKTPEMVGLGLNLSPDPLAPPSSSAALLPHSSSTEARGAGVGSRNHEPLGSVLMMLVCPWSQHILEGKEGSSESLG